MSEHGLGSGLGLGLEQKKHFLVRLRLRLRVSVKTIVLSVDPGIKLWLTVLVTSRRYCQTNSAQTLNETNRFTRLNADPGLGLGLEQLF